MKVAQEPTVLVVEDDPSARRLIVAALKTLGVVYDVADGEAAAAMLAKHTPDVVCLDLSLPDASGFEVCRRIRLEPRLAHTRVLAVSGRTAVTDRAFAREVGADDFLEKPFRVRELIKRVEGLLRAARQSAAQAAAVKEQAAASAPSTTGEISDVRPISSNFDSTTNAAPSGAGEVARD
jgi:DNA-binding response OmpR family regulator